MRAIRPPRPGTGTAAFPWFRWLVIGWLALSILGLLFEGAGLIVLGWFSGPDAMPAGPLPQRLIPLLDVPIFVAVTGYCLTIWRAWRREPAVNAWLIGAAGHLSYVLAGVVLSGGMGLSGAVIWDGLGTLTRVALPGFLLLQIEWSRIENPRQP